MKVYQIDYDLRNQRNYPALIERIKTYRHVNPLESTWLITSNQTAAEVRDYWSKAIDSDDGLLVTRLQGEAAWVGLKQPMTQSIKSLFDLRTA
ncbi:MAG: hypothetical protein RSC68_29260 [Acinetobacter sp.]